MRCLANALLLKPSARQIFVDLGYQSKACGKLKSESYDDEFLASRILLLSTYAPNIVISSLIEDSRLAEALIQKLDTHAQSLRQDGSGKQKIDPMQDMALAETTKLIFNLTELCKAKASSFTLAIPHIASILRHHEIRPTEPLEQPLGPLVNALLNLDLDHKDVASTIFPEDSPMAVTNCLVHLLDLSLKRYRDSELEQTVTPLMGAILRLHEIAPNPVRESLRKDLLPSTTDREKVLGKNDNLPSKLLQNSTNPLTPSFREVASKLFFDMSDKDPSKFVDNVGYGFASGYLFQNNIPMPENVASNRRGSPTTGDFRPVNPITGQFLDAEKVADLPEMTDEEKEREAERLFVLFERPV
jgi:hypothetical protein